MGDCVELRYIVHCAIMLLESHSTNFVPHATHQRYLKHFGQQFEMINRPTMDKHTENGLVMDSRLMQKVIKKFMEEQQHLGCMWLLQEVLCKQWPLKYHHLFQSLCLHESVFHHLKEHINHTHCCYLSWFWLCVLHGFSWFCQGKFGHWTKMCSGIGWHGGGRIESKELQSYQS